MFILIAVVGLLFLSIRTTATVNFYDPTPSEKERYLSMYSQSWGEQLVRQNSTRILLLGGSISVGCYCSNGGSYASRLSDFISRYNNSYVLNKSIPGTRPYIYIGDSYDFESWPTDHWPNTVIIELAVNSDVSWSTAKDLDNLIFLLNEKWLTNGLPIPEVLLINFLDIRMPLFSFHGEDTMEKREEFLNNLYDEKNWTFQSRKWFSDILRCVCSFLFLPRAFRHRCSMASI